jgi:hypothetical protein
MQRSTILLSTSAVLVLSAGLVVGRLWGQLSSRVPVVTKPAEVEHPRGWFPDALGLTPDQDQKMKAIWDDARQRLEKNGEHRRTLDKDRDAAIRGLLTPDQSVAYDKIFQDYRTHWADLNKERDQVIPSANERCRALLSPDQQLKWDAMPKDMHDHDRRGPGGPLGRNRNGPSSRPFDPAGPGTGPS